MATVICPNCGGENTVTKRGGQECAYCGTMLQCPKPKGNIGKKESERNDSTFPCGEYIIELAEKYSTEEKVADEVRKFLINNDSVPLDIFDHFTVKQVNWLYLPMIRYSGRVETEWSCNQVIERQREIGQRPIRDRNGNIERYETIYETYDEYLPKSGKGSDSFDVLIPCGKGVNLSKGLKECYKRIDYYSVIGHEKEWPCKNIVPLKAIVDTAVVDLNSKDGKVARELSKEISKTAKDCSFGEFDRITDKHLTSTHAFDKNTGFLYYVPFVQVFYSYKGETHEWVFMVSPSTQTAEPTIPKMDKDDNPLMEMQSMFQKQREEISGKENINIFLAGIIIPLIGGIILMCLISSVIEKVKARLEAQIQLAALLFKLKRHENLAKLGIKVDMKHNVYTNHKDSDKPKTIEEILAYFSETEMMRQKAIRIIKAFWWWLLALVLLVAGAIIGYNRWDDAQKEKMWEEELARIESENKKLTDEVTRKFNAEMVGRSYEGSDLEVLHKKHMKIEILDESQLQYQLGVNTGKFDDHFNDIINWENPKVVPYSLLVEKKGPHASYDRDEYCLIIFDGYKTTDILRTYGDLCFEDEFKVPVDTTANNSDILSESYYLKRVK